MLGKLETQVGDRLETQVGDRLEKDFENSDVPSAEYSNCIWSIQYQIGAAIILLDSRGIF